MPKSKVNSPEFVYNDSHLSLKHQYCIVQCFPIMLWSFRYFAVFPVFRVFQVNLGTANCINMLLFGIKL